MPGVLNGASTGDETLRLMDTSCPLALARSLVAIAAVCQLKSLKDASDRTGAFARLLAFRFALCRLSRRAATRSDACAMLRSQPASEDSNLRAKWQSNRTELKHAVAMGSRAAAAL